MAKYSVMVELLKTYEIEVEADSPEEAKEKGNDVQSTITANDGDLIDVETKVIDVQLVEIAEDKDD